MAVTLGPKDIPTQPLPPSGAEDAATDAARKNAQELFTTQAAKKKVSNESSEQISADAKAKGTGIASAAPTDVLVAVEPTAVLDALLAATGREQASAQEPRAGDALAAFDVVKGLMGKPNNLAVPEAFAHPNLLAHSDEPLGFSRETLAVVSQVVAAKEGQPNEAMKWLSLVPTHTRAVDLDDASVRTKSILQNVNKWRAIGEKLLAMQQQMPAAPQVPQAVLATLQKNWPQIAAIGKQLSLEGKTKNTDIEIPGPAIIQLEKIAGEALGAFSGMIAELRNIAASPEAAAAFSAELEQASNGSSTAGMRFQSQIDQGMTALASPAVTGVAVQAKPKQQSHFIKGLWNAIMTAPKPPKDNTVELKTAAPGAVTTFSPTSGFDLATADIESAIYFIMMQSAQDETAGLRDQMSTMQERNKEKAEMRARMTHMKEEQAQAKKMLHKEFDYLVANGAIAKNVPFSEYQAWRQVTWTEEGDAALSQPMPELPDSLKFGPSGPPSFPATGAPGYEVPADMAAKVAALAKQYGVSEQDMAFLYSYFVFVQKNGSDVFDLSGAEVSGPNWSFEGFLLSPLGLSQKGHNQGKVDALFKAGGAIALDAGFVIPASKGAAGGACTADEMHDLWIGQDSDGAQCAATVSYQQYLEALRSSEPFASDTELQALIKGLDASAFQELVASGKGRIKFDQIAARVAALAPNSKAAAVLVRICEVEKYDSPSVPSASEFAKQAGLPYDCYWSGYGDSATSEKYATYCNKDYGGDDDIALALGLWRAFTMPPFSNNETVQGILDQIKAKTGETNLESALRCWFAGTDADFDNEGNMEITASLLNAVNEVSPGCKALGMLLAIEKRYEDDPDAWMEAGQNSSFTSDPAAYFDDTKAAQEKKRIEEDQAKAKADEAAGETPPPQTALSIADARNTEETARKEAEKEAKKKDDAARQCVAALREGSGLEGEDGAHTGSFEDMELTMQGFQDKLDSMGDLSQMDTMRLQMMMDRRQKLLEALSNIMKKFSATKDTIIANEK